MTLYENCALFQNSFAMIMHRYVKLSRVASFDLDFFDLRTECAQRLRLLKR